MSSLDEAKRSKTEATWLGCLLLLAFAVYANSLFNGFVFDDHFQIEQNSYLRSFSSLGKILTASVWSFQGSEGAPNFYRPVMMLGFFLCHMVFGSSPFGYHLVSILLHVGVVALVFAVAKELFQDFRVGIAAGAAFSLHPIHTESVAWIAGVTDIELSLFFLLSFLLFLKLGSADGKHALRLQTGMLASFAAALLSKEVAVTLPVLATLFEHLYREDRSQASFRTKLTRYGGLWILTGIYLTVRLILFRGVLAKSSHADLTWPQVLLHGVSLFGQYVRRFFWPVPLSFYNPFQKGISRWDPSVLLGFFALLAVVALFVVLWLRRRLLSFPILWVLVTLALALNARWMPGTVFAERYWYLPSVGCCWLLGVGLVELLKRRSATKPIFRWSFAAGTAVIALLAARATIARNRDWKSDRALCTQTLVVHPHAAHFRVNLGEMSWQAGDHDEAERQWRLALADEPNEPFALWSLGKAMLEQKRYDESLAYLQQAISAAPQPYAAPHIYRGRVFLALGKKPDAEAEFRRAVEIDPFRADARNELGRFYLDAGNYAEAEQQFLASVASIPSTDGYKGLAEVSEVLNKPLQAEAAWKQVLTMEPFDARAHLGLGKIYLARKSFSDAQREFQAVLLMNPHNEEALAAINSIKSGAPGSQP